MSLVLQELVSSAAGSHLASPRTVPHHGARVGAVPFRDGCGSGFGFRSTFLPPLPCSASALQLAALSSAGPTARKAVLPAITDPTCF